MLSTGKIESISRGGQDRPLSIACLPDETDRYNLDHGYPHYYWDFLTYVRKMENHVGVLKAQDGKSINVIHCRDIEIDSDLNVRIRMKKNSPEFEDYTTTDGI